MCILFIAVQQHPDYPLVICANRDEFHKRPTQAAGYWPDQPGMLAGKDLQAGGTWLGINQHGNFAAVTNLRTAGKTNPDRKSRGDIVRMALEIPAVIDQSWLSRYAADYNPFNLIYGSLQKLYCFNSGTRQQTELKKGFHAISNGALNEVWPKMAKGQQQLEALVKSTTAIDESELLGLLKDQTKAAEDQLPETGIAAEWELLLSSIFICSEAYGTRSSNLILYGNDSSIKFVEVEYSPKGEQLSKKNFTLITDHF